MQVLEVLGDKGFPVVFYNSVLFDFWRKRKSGHIKTCFKISGFDFCFSFRESRLTARISN